MERYFVRVFAANAVGLARLQGFGLDLFASTAGADDNDRFGIDGLLSIDEVERLVGAGYQVLIEAHEATRSRAHLEVRSFDDWVREEA